MYVIPYIPTSISMICDISMLQLMRMRHDTKSTQCTYNMSTQLRENKDFNGNVEEKESELIEQQRPQLKRKKG